MIINNSEVRDENINENVDVVIYTNKNVINSDFDNITML